MNRCLGRLRHARAFLAIVAVAASPSILIAADRFDGKWLTTVSCASARDALGYSYRFTSEVRDSSLRGLYGTEGQPKLAAIEGKIEADGTAKLYATGRTGSKEYVPGRDTPRGTEYSYTIDAHFKDKTVTGTRVEGRACSFQFEKQ